MHLRIYILNASYHMHCKEYNAVRWMYNTEDVLLSKIVQRTKVSRRD